MTSSDRVVTDPRFQRALDAWRAAFCEYEPNGMAPDEYVLIAKIIAALDAYLEEPATRVEEPRPIDLVHQLHTALHGDSWARPEPPAAVWATLLDEVRALVAARTTRETR